MGIYRPLIIPNIEDITAMQTDLIETVRWSGMPLDHEHVRFTHPHTASLAVLSGADIRQALRESGPDAKIRQLNNDQIRQQILKNLPADSHEPKNIQSQGNYIHSRGAGRTPIVTELQQKEDPQREERYIAINALCALAEIEPYKRGQRPASLTWVSFYARRPPGLAQSVRIIVDRYLPPRTEMHFAPIQPSPSPEVGTPYIEIA